MRRVLFACCALAACSTQPAERYGFITRLGDDTISVENVLRRGNTLTIDAVDRFPRVRGAERSRSSGDRFGGPHPSW